MDVMLPGMDGYEVCRRLRANPALAEAPVIMITALDDRNSRLVGLLAGADDFLIKPFDGLEIQIRVKNIMRFNRYRNLIAERSRFQWVIENDDKAYLILDEDGEIQYANARALVYFHLPEEYAGIDFDRQIARYYQCHAPESELEDGVDDNIAYLVQPESETARAFWLRLETLHTPGQDKHQHLLRATDVTDKMSVQQDMSKMHLLVAHKLRTPVSLIYGNMSLLNMRMEQIPENKVKTMVKSAWQNSERLVKQVHDILQYLNAPIALAEGMPMEVTQLPAMIHATCKTLEIGYVNISFSSELTRPCSGIGISAAAMEIIAHEILESSKKFHPRESPHVEVLVEMQDDKKIRVQFLDDGQSMTAEQIARAQMPYTQGEKWFTGEAPGMGLGIPTVAGLVWQSGGSFRIKNREDMAGISVAIILPLL
jgi:CheY-like chemotaxis protein